MDVAEFLTIHNSRGSRIMWFLGAGSSATAGIPTAGDVIWHFKRHLYCVDHGVTIRVLSDLSDAAIRAHLQSYLDSTGRFPALNAEDEYADYFEAVYPDEHDRRAYIHQLVASARPSFGHKVLASILKLGMGRIVWTTNFDRLVEDAANEVAGTSGWLTVASLQEPQVAVDTIREERWPLLVKLHGDFQFARLKNTLLELDNPDASLRKSLIDACQRYGLAVIGYSGRDHSIMDALHEAIGDGKGFPAGLFWFKRADGLLYDRVSELIDSAKAVGITAEVIAAETFDELMPRTLDLVPDIPSDIEKLLNERPSRIRDIAIPSPGRGFPWIRLNALPVLEAPAICRKIVCSIGGTSEVREAIQACNAPVIGARKRAGVIAFGSDQYVRSAFNAYDITEFDVFNLELQRLTTDSSEHGLLYEALCHALSRQRCVWIDRRGHDRVMVIDLERTASGCFDKLKGAVGGDVHGTISECGLNWAEAVRLRLDVRLGQLWLVLEPTIWHEHTTDPSADERADAFVAGRLKRYNQVWNNVVAAWANIITDGEQEAELRAFGIGDGIDARFLIGRSTAYSKRGH